MFNRSRLITNPSPGISTFPFGTSAGDVFCVGGAEVAGATVVVLGDAVAFCAGAGFGATGSTAAGVSTAAGAGGGTGAGGGGAITDFDNGLAGLTGLDMLVGFVALFTHVFTVSIHEPTTGCPYGLGQVEVCCCVIDPT